MPCAAASVSTLRPSGQEISTIFPQLATVADRDLHHSLDGDRGDQSRPGPHLHEHRHDHFRPAGDGFVDQLRSGKRERRLARVRRPDVERAVRSVAAHCVAAMAQRLSAQPISGRSLLLARATRCSISAGPRASAGPPARCRRCRRSAQFDAERPGRRPRDRDAHHPV